MERAVRPAVIWNVVHHYLLSLKIAVQAIDDGLHEI
jgi:hypothetical protein